MNKHPTQSPYREKIVTIYIDPDTRRIVEAEVQATGSNFSKTICRIITEWAAAHETQTPR